MAGEFVIDTPQKLKRKLEMVILFFPFIYYSLRLTIIVSLEIFLFFKIIVTLEYQCSIFFPH